MLSYQQNEFVGCSDSNKRSQTHESTKPTHVRAGRDTHIKVSFGLSQEQKQLCRCVS